MNTFIEQLMLAEKAAENIYFQKVNQELIEALHRQESLAKQAAAGAALRPMAEAIPTKERLS